MTERKYKVTGQCPIRGMDREYVAPGDVVTLDPDNRAPGATNVEALIIGGHLEEIKAAQASSASATAKGDKGK